MITILKHGKCNFKKTCPNCGCLFAFQKEDIESNYYAYNEVIHSIECPECSQTIEVENLE